jgi:membrane fusion protein, heavy metal efflux system
MIPHLKCLVLIGLLVALQGCDKTTPSKEKHAPPAEVRNAVKETDLTTITLTAEAESRLGIETAVVERRAVARHRTFGGEVVSVAGRAVTVSAPMSGTLLAPEERPAVRAGEKVSGGEPIYRLLLALPQQDLLSVEEEASLRRVEYDLAKAKVKRAQQLLEDKAGSARDLEDAQGELSRSEVSLKTALARLEMLRKGDLDSAGDGLSALTITSPVDGIVQTLHAAPGQTVTSGMALLEIVGIDPVWIKVPVYVGDLRTIEPNRPASVHSLGDVAGVEARSAEPVVTSVSANPESVTTDLVYELANEDLSYRPGQRVGVTLALRGSAESLVVPYSAIVYDMYGGAWVYVSAEAHVYRRQRVELRHVLGDVAVLARGPAVGAKVVRAGAAELFGTEFGVGK